MDTDEWEYEYDYDATQAVYFTLDLTTHNLASVLAKSNASNIPNTTRHGKSPDPADQGNDNVVDTTANAVAEREDDAAESDHEQFDMQIVDIGGESPMIAYRGKFYSCHWATDLGTNMYFGPPDDSSLRSFASGDLIGLSRARLIAEPATLRQRSALLDAARPEGIIGHPSTYETVTKENDQVYASDIRGVQIEVAPDASEQRITQARFLEQWAAIRVQRGLKPNVPIAPMRTRDYRLPADWDVERRQFLAAEAEARSRRDGADSDSEEWGATKRADGGRPKPPRRKKGEGRAKRGRSKGSLNAKRSGSAAQHDASEHGDGDGDEDDDQTMHDETPAETPRTSDPENDDDADGGADEQDHRGDDVIMT